MSLLRHSSMYLQIQTSKKNSKMIINFFFLKKLVKLHKYKNKVL